MEYEIYNLISNISIPAAIVVVFIILNRAGILSLIAAYLRSKINDGENPTLREKINKIESNHLNEINRRLEVLEENDIRIQEDIINIRERLARIEAKVNNK